MTKVYKKHIFICENERDSSKTKSCGIVGAEIRAKLKTEIVKKGLKKDIRVNRSGCLGKCLKVPVQLFILNQIGTLILIVKIIKNF